MAEALAMLPAREAKPWSKGGARARVERTQFCEGGCRPIRWMQQGGGGGGGTRQRDASFSHRRISLTVMVAASWRQFDRQFFPVLFLAREATGNTFDPELDPFLQFALEIGHVTPGYPVKVYL